MKRLLNTIITLTILLLSVPLAEAIDITLAEVRNGVAVVQGSKAAKQTMIVWETNSVGQTTKVGGFSFSGIVPADCVGQLRIGTDTINVALNNCARLAPAPVLKTGQTKCWDIGANEIVNEIACAGTGQDGEIQAGVALPSPRFTDNGDGTVTDKGTSLIWLRDGGCLGLQTWDDALVVANALAGGNVACGLADGSVAGDWRLPNIRELESLVDYATFSMPSLPAGHPFINIAADSYWSSTLYARSPNSAWQLNFAGGDTRILNRPYNIVWVIAVRGGL